MNRPDALSSPDLRIWWNRLLPSQWELWAQPLRVRLYCLVTELAAVVAVITLLGSEEITQSDIWVFLALVALGVGQAELGRRVERIRRRVSGVAHINMTSVWTFAAVMLLPPPLTAALVVVLYWHLAVRSWYRLQRVPVWRTTNNATGVILTCLAAHQAMVLTGIHDMREALAHDWQGFAAVATAVAVYFVVGALVVIGARERIIWTPSGLFGSWTDNLLELATLGLGALNALALVTMPGLALLILPSLLLLHRSVLVKQLEVAATTDDKTGVYNTAGWHHTAEREFHRSRERESPFALLMIDLDHFKRINDTYGHLVGDAVLRAVAQAIKSEVRDRDAVGRFGGEEFVVLLPDVHAAEAHLVAERIRQAVMRIQVPVDADAELVTGLSTSIGVAIYPDAGTGVQELLDAADTALYRAKNAGRNQVVHATPVG